MDQSGMNIYWSITSRVLVSNVLFQGNTNSYSYGSAGLFIGYPCENDAPISTDITIEKSKFLENRNSSNDQRSAGAIFIGRVKGVTISESKFADNQGGGAGAIMFQNAPENRIVASTFSANKGDLCRSGLFPLALQGQPIERSNLVGHGSLAVNADVDSQPETEEYTPSPHPAT